MDFTLSVPVSQKIAFFIYSYSNNNGVYSLTEEVTHDQPP